MPFADWRITALHQALYTFNTNGRELVQLLIILSDGEVFLELQRDESREALEAAHAEVVRLLHNYLASAFSLVDHARRVIEDEGLASESLLPAYRERIRREYAEDPMHRFLQGLRAYTLHLNAPVSVAELRAVRTAPDGPLDSSCGFQLDLRSLRSWPNWDKPAREFLAAAGQTINLLELVRKYNSRIKTLYSWFFLRLREDGLKRAGIDPGSLVVP